MPAACTTAVTGCSAGTAARSSPSRARSATSQAATVTVAPRPVSSASSSAAPGACGPLLLTSSSRSTPCAVTRCLANSLPSVPVAPVIRTVPPGLPRSGASAGASGAATRASRGTLTCPALMAHCGSPSARACGSARCEAGSPSRSTRVNRPGFSDCAERIRPHTVACATSSTSSSAVAPTAPRVTKTRRVYANRSSSTRIWASARTRAAAPCADSTVSVPGSDTQGTKRTSGTGPPASTASPSSTRSG